MFIVTSVIYRPIEQLLSRSIAERRALGQAEHSLRTPLLLQGAFALAFLVVALALREPLHRRRLRRLGDAVLGARRSACSPTRRRTSRAAGWPATSSFALYGGSCCSSRCRAFLFPLAVAIGIARGPVRGRARHPRRAVRLAGRRAVGAAAPDARADGAPTPATAPSLRAGGGFALAVFAVMLAEQTILNAPVLLADATPRTPRWPASSSTSLLIARAPLQLFQAVQTSLLPHLAGLQRDRVDASEFARAIRVTLLAIAGFAGAVALGLLVDRAVGDGPALRRRLRLRPRRAWRSSRSAWASTSPPGRSTRPRSPAAASARPRRRGWSPPRSCSSCGSLLAVVDDELLRVEVGYLGATALLCAALALIERRGVAAG